MILAIDGFGGSGKTTLASQLAQFFGGEVISLDDFSGPGMTWNHSRFISEVIPHLRSAEPFRYGVQHFDELEPSSFREIRSRLIIVEGVSALTSELTDRVGIWWDLSIWVECPREIREDRILSRDPDLLSLWYEQWWPSEEHYFDTQRPDLRADLRYYSSVSSRYPIPGSVVMR